MIQIFAHRGAKALSPENTLPAFKKALEMGVHGVELDVQCSQDGELMVIHDYTVDRTTDGTGKVAELTLSELRELDAGSYMGYVYLCTKIPTLEDALDLIGHRCVVNIEVKSMDLQGGDEVEKVAKLVADRQLYDQVIVSSFNPVSLIEMRYVNPAIRLGLLYADPLPSHLFNAWLSPIIAPEALHPRHDLVDETYMAEARRLNKAVNVWTVNDVEEARRLDALGVDALISDVPDVIMQALDGRGQPG